jgi:hypothetical protein
MRPPRCHLGFLVSLGDCVPDGIDVASYGPREALHSDDARPARIVEPAFQLRPIAAESRLM